MTPRSSGSRAPFRLVYSVRDPSSILYGEELTARSGGEIEAAILYSRRAPAGHRRPPGRITAADLVAAEPAAAEPAAGRAAAGWAAPGRAAADLAAPGLAEADQAASGLAEAERAAGGWAAAERPAVYVCGPSGFVAAAADLLTAAGHDPQRIRTERFGPGGGGR